MTVFCRLNISSDIKNNAVQQHEEEGMLESLLVTVLPVGFLIVLFGGGELMRRQNIDMDGEPPIGHVLFLSSKYAIPLVWAVMVAHSWGLKLAFLNVPALLQGLAVGLWVAGFTLLFIGRFGLDKAFRIGSSKERTNLTIAGLFRFSRNPMYLGVYATLLAATLYTLNPIVGGIGIFVVAVHHKIVLAEEQHLRTVFGEQYLVYCQRVRRYL
jgi:protein-S-isoprenylcysteine O-methyltransferase Ste14